MQKWDDALNDATKCIEMKPDWGKGYGRHGRPRQCLLLPGRDL